MIKSRLKHFTVLLAALGLFSLALTQAAPASGSPVADATHSGSLSQGCSPVRAAHGSATVKSGCRHRKAKFKSGSRKFKFVQREIGLRPRKSEPLPRCDNYVVRIFEDGSGAVTSCTLNARAGVGKAWPWDWFADSGFWSKGWEVAKCVSAVLLAVVPIAKAAKFVKELGGMRKTAELLVKAGNWSDVKKAAPYLAAEILGIATIETHCF